MQAHNRQVIAEIKRYLGTQRDIQLGILFGSMAGGQPNRNSDLDIAVLGNQPLNAERRLELISRLANISGRSVDLVDLKTAGIAVVRSVLLEGQLLFSRDATVYPSQITRMLLDSADFLPYRERMLRERREAWLQ